jgi:hypothetical protein
MNKMNVIKLPYFLVIAIDALWAIALFVPALFAILVGIPEFQPVLLVRTIMGIGGIMMTGWTLLLIWAVKEPVKRRFVILLTAFPVVFGLFFIALMGFLDGRTTNLWILVKTMILFTLMVNSYVLAGKIEMMKNEIQDITNNQLCYCSYIGR